MSKVLVQVHVFSAIPLIYGTIGAAGNNIFNSFQQKEIFFFFFQPRIKTQLNTNTLTKTHKITQKQTTKTHKNTTMAIIKHNYGNHFFLLFSSPGKLSECSLKTVGKNYFPQRHWWLWLCSLHHTAENMCTGYHIFYHTVLYFTIAAPPAPFEALYSYGPSNFLRPSITMNIDTTTHTHKNECSNNRDIKIKRERERREIKRERERESERDHMQVEYDDNPRPTRPTLRSTNNRNTDLRLCLHLIGTVGTCTICLDDTEQ